MQAQIIRFLYKHMVKPVLFVFNPEVMHDAFLSIGYVLWRTSVGKRITKSLFHYHHKTLMQEYCWITFENPVWLAAWFDKDALLPSIMWDVWFGYVELWSVTAQPYEWNKKPRAIRLKKDKWLLINYWLKNNWVDKMIETLQHSKWISIPVCISVAKTNSPEAASLEDAIADYCESLIKLEQANVSDMYTINISCPNTFWGEPFTTPDRLQKLLDAIHWLNLVKPVFIKMPLSLPRDEFQWLLDVCLQYDTRLKWVIISNLNKDRACLQQQLPADQKWWISGKPTQKQSTAYVWKTYTYCGDRLLIIWCGWIFTAENAYEKIKAGASLLQLITWMIYEWPQAIGAINQWLVKLMKEDGYEHISEAIGTAH